MSALWISIVMASLGPQATPGPSSQSDAFLRLVNCRTITDAGKRLACFDQEVASIEAAASNNELVVMDRHQVRQARRGLFGFALPKIPLFDVIDGEEEEPEIISTIDSAWSVGQDKWGFRLEDGARWIQTDSRNLAMEPKQGDRVRIRRGALGSYLANVEGQTAIRVKRVD